MSLTEGVPGARITIGRTPRVTLGVPGTGLSWTETMEHGHRASHGAPAAPQASQARPGWQVALIVVALIAVLMIILGGGGHP